MFAVVVWSLIDAGGLFEVHIAEIKTFVNSLLLYAQPLVDNSFGSKL